MANIYAPFGFSFGKPGEGISGTFGLDTSKFIASTDTNKCFYGDPVKILASGYVTQWTPGTSAVALAGIFAGCEYFSISSNQMRTSRYWPGTDASGDVIVKLVPLVYGANANFLVQVSGGPVLQSDVGSNIDVTLGAGNTLTGSSTAAVDYTTINTTNTLPYRISGLYLPTTPQSGGGLGNGSDITTASNYCYVSANVNVLAGV